MRDNNKLISFPISRQEFVKNSKENLDFNSFPNDKLLNLNSKVESFGIADTWACESKDKNNKDD